MFAGFRACLRCRPLDFAGAPPDWVKTLVAEIDAAPEARITDSDLRIRGLDPARARRFFLKQYGMTFQAYCRAKRMGQAIDQLRRGAPVDEVALENGYDSHSGFRDAFVKTFGRPPGKGRDVESMYVAWIESPLGPLITAATTEGICLLEFTERRMLEAQFATLRRRFSCPIVPGRNGHIEVLERELNEYFAGARNHFTVPTVAPGTPFQTRVWDALKTIPFGKTWSYEDLARAIGSPGASRAVGTANGMNRVAILIPCHRVVNKDGKLGGYGGGVWRKQRLLELERQALPFSLD